MVQLKKSEILNGKQEIKSEYIPLLKKEIDLRPLTDGEYNQILGIQQDIGTFKTQLDLGQAQKLDLKNAVKTQSKKLTKDMAIELNPKLAQDKQFEADCLAASFGLSHSGERWGKSDVEQLQPLGVVSEIAQAVIRISKLENPLNLNEDVESFREGE